LPTTPLPPKPSTTALFPKLGPARIGVAAIDASGRVREKTLLRALGWRAGEALDLRIADQTAALWPAPYGSIHVDSRDQFALPRGCRTLLGIEAGDRVLLAASTEINVLLVYSAPVVVEWIRQHLADHFEVLHV
ncbi:hypothetical protein KDL01_26855, partial [Actinospica durhamensis]